MKIFDAYLYVYRINEELDDCDVIVKKGKMYCPESKSNYDLMIFEDEETKECTYTNRDELDIGSGFDGHYVWSTSLDFDRAVRAFIDDENEYIEANKKTAEMVYKRLLKLNKLRYPSGDAEEQILKMPIEDLGFPPYVSNALRREGLEKVEDIVYYIHNTGPITGIRMIGRSAEQTIVDRLWTLGFTV